MPQALSMRIPLLRPARLMAVGFVAVIVVSTGLLMLPVSSADGSATGVITALFTATSATCVTGLAVVDTAEHWSRFGEIVILALIQIGGLGVMPLATMLGIVVARRVGMRMQLAVQAETKSIQFSDGRGLVLRIMGTSLAIEAIVAACSPSDSGRRTTNPGRGRSISVSFTPSRRSTTRASPCTPTT